MSRPPCSWSWRLPATETRVAIDRKKAAELTTALRVRGLRLDAVRSRRDESEPLIRLPDMWAGCIRAATLGRALERTLLERARVAGYLTEVGPKTTR